MNILVIGAKLAGLLFASQIKQVNPDFGIGIIKKNTQEGMPGRDVTLLGWPPRHPGKTNFPSRQKALASSLGTASCR